MRAIKIILAFAALFIFAGCVASSLHPLFTEEDLIFDPALLGTWAEQDEDDTLTFKDKGGKAYLLICTVEGQKLEFEVHLVQLGELKFLDVYPKIEKSHDIFHLVPAHTFWKISRDGDILRVARLDADWLMRMVAAEKIKISHQRLEDRIILTAPAKELQKFVVGYANNAFSDFGEFHHQN